MEFVVMRFRSVVAVLTAFVSVASFAAPSADKGGKTPALEPLQIVDANGKTLGRIGPTSNGDIAVYGTFNGVFSGFIVGVGSHMEALPFQRDPFLFESTNCTGAVYMIPPNSLGVPTVAVKIGASVYVYTADLATPKDIIAFSEMSNNGSCQTYPIAQPHPGVYPATGSDLGAIHPLPWTMK
jgi:hypothetical protein